MARKTTVKTLTIEEAAASAVAKGHRLDTIKASGAVDKRTGTVLLNEQEFSWSDFCGHYWAAVNANQKTAKRTVPKVSFSL